MKENEETRIMYRTPYGLLTMTYEIWERFKKAPESERWESLYKMVSRGEHQKAKAMQWAWDVIQAPKQLAEHYKARARLKAFQDHEFYLGKRLLDKLDKWDLN